MGILKRILAVLNWSPAWYKRAPWWARAFMLTSIVIMELALGLTVLTFWEIREWPHVWPAIYLTKLGNKAFETGQSDAARDKYEQAYSWAQWAYGENHPKTVRYLNSLGNFYLLDGRPQTAQNYYEQAATVLGESFGTKSRQYARQLCHIANAHRRNKKKDKAYATLETALKIFLAIEGPEGMNVGRTLHNLGKTYGEEPENYASAHSQLVRSREILESHLGPHHLEVRKVIDTLAGLERARGNFDQVKSLRLQIIEGIIQQPDKDNPTELFFGYMFLCQDQKKFGKLEDAIISCTHATRAVPHSKSKVWLTSLSLGYLSEIRKTQGNMASAVTLAEQSYLVSHEISGAHHGRSIARLAGLYDEVGRPEDAIRMWRLFDSFCETSTASVCKDRVSAP